MLTSLRKTWTWQSISPGISVRPPQSTHVRPRRLDRRVRDLADGLALDEELEAVPDLAHLRIEQPEVPEQEGGHADLRALPAGRRVRPAGRDAEIVPPRFRTVIPVEAADRNSFFPGSARLSRRRSIRAKRLVEGVARAAHGADRVGLRAAG